MSEAALAASGLPRDLWHYITTVNGGAYIESWAYAKLVLVAKMFTIPNAKEVFIRWSNKGTESLLPNGQLHSVSGRPARRNSLHQQWRRDGLLHRNGPPAVVLTERTQFWCVNGKKRTGLPFCIKVDGTQGWDSAGELSTLELGDMKDFILGGSGKFIDSTGISCWYQNGKMHRVGLPAIMHINGRISWVENGKKHRIGLPATITAGGDQLWHVDGVPTSPAAVNAIRAGWLEDWHARGMFLDLTLADLD